MKIRKLDHTKSKKVENWGQIKALAKEVADWFDANNGDLNGNFPKGYALHHTQVSEDPFNFFVVDEDQVKVKGYNDMQNAENFYFKSKVIINPEIITALETTLEDVEDLDQDGNKLNKKVAVNNLRDYKEACLSFPHRKEKNMERFFKIKVRYQTHGIMGMKETEEWVSGLKAHIFQHEIDHGNGIDMFFGDGATIVAGKTVYKDVN